jgi:hypothetical protein
MLRQNKSLPTGGKIRVDPLCGLGPAQVTEALGPGRRLTRSDCVTWPSGCQRPRRHEGEDQQGGAAAEGGRSTLCSEM